MWRENKAKKNWRGGYSTCPVSRGLPTSMYESTLKNMCKRFKADKKADGIPEYPVCQACKRYPKEITFIEEKEKGKAMKGICEVCKQEKEISKHHDKMMCNDCSGMVRIFKLNPQGAFDELVFRGFQPAELHDGLNEIRERKEDIETLSKNVDRLSKANKNQALRILELEKELNRAGEGECFSSDARKAASEIAWDLAMGSLSGRVTGVKLADIEVLKEIGTE